MEPINDLFAENRERLESYLLQNRIKRNPLTLVVNKSPKQNAKKQLKENQKKTLKNWRNNG